MERDTPLKRVKAAGDWIAALEMMRFGKRLSPLETLLKDYLFYEDSHQMVGKGQKTILQEMAERVNRPLPSEYEQKFYEGFLTMKQRELVDVFLEAIKKRDADKIHEMAYAVEMLKSHEGFYDQTRAAILVLKGMVENGLSKIPANEWTVRKVAEIVQWPQMTKDGLKQLKKWCKDLGFPLADGARKPGVPATSSVQTFPSALLHADLPVAH